MKRLRPRLRRRRRAQPAHRLRRRYGFGQRGPYAGEARLRRPHPGRGRHAVAHAAGRRAGRRATCRSTLADRITGLHAAYAVTAALYARERTGKGQAVEVPMFEAAAQFVLGDHMGGRTFDPPIGEPGYARLLTPHRGPYATRDGYVCAADLQRQAVAQLLRRDRRAGALRARPALRRRRPRAASTSTRSTPTSRR